MDYVIEIVYDIHIDRLSGNNKHISSTPRHQQTLRALIRCNFMPVNGIEIQSEIQKIAYGA